MGGSEGEEVGSEDRKEGRGRGGRIEEWEETEEGDT